jgi:glucose-1-phosphate cytidylyltransferase
MKLVIFAGGLGTRMREETEFKPKPMVEIGGKPVLWHIMKMYSCQGVQEFVILAGYKGEVIKRFFLDFEAMTQNFTRVLGDGSLTLHGESESGWKVTVLDTGLNTPTGGRLLEAQAFIGDEPFFCSYGDGLADINLQSLLNTHQHSSSVATLTAFKPTNRFGILSIDGQMVTEFREKPKMSDWINIGFFLFESKIFNYLDRSEMLEGNALSKLASDGKLAANFHDGFWEPMDTFREYESLNELWESGNAPWKIW